jgi:hypothetical protein
MNVRYAMMTGRPPGQHRASLQVVTWAAWWTSEPSAGRRPDAYGGALSQHEVPSRIMEALKLAGIERATLERLPNRRARMWRQVLRAEVIAAQNAGVR